ncbi:hypothetical protein SAMN04488061_1286 [Filomicrobium insigne]|uniref:Uncharacterized protein n=1 Tax=Filomicrobium insigne TaxID=418854 RepID=A0A1H0L8K1_9HYPH|nr:hypothetical protein SAMN04488061_1286 [Filomicrobium insigne]
MVPRSTWSLPVLRRKGNLRGTLDPGNTCRDDGVVGGWLAKQMAAGCDLPDLFRSKSAERLGRLLADVVLGCLRCQA